MINSLHIKNFQAHADTYIELSPTVTVITGESDQGKTSILRALRKVLRNVPKGDFFIRWGQKTCQIDIDVNGETISRKVGRKDGTNVYSVGDTPFSNFGVNVPEEVRTAMGISDVQVFDKDKIDLNIRTQHESLFLVGGTGVESLRGRVFGKITGSDKINKAVTGVNSDIRSLKIELSTLHMTKEAYDAELDKLAYLSEVGTLVNTMNELVKKCVDCENQISKLRRIQESLVVVKRDGKRLANVVNTLKSVDCKAMTLYCEHFAKLVNLDSKRGNITIQIEELEPISALEVSFSTELVEKLIADVAELRKLSHTIADVTIKDISMTATIMNGNNLLHKAETDLEALKQEIGICPVCERPFEVMYAH